MTIVTLVNHALQPGQLEIAAAGGADRRSAMTADRPMNQYAKRATGLAAPLSRGGQSHFR